MRFISSLDCRGVIRCCPRSAAYHVQNQALSTARTNGPNQRKSHYHSSSSSVQFQYRPILGAAASGRPSCRAELERLPVTSMQCLFGYASLAVTRTSGGETSVLMHVQGGYVCPCPGIAATKGNAKRTPDVGLSSQPLPDGRASQGSRWDRSGMSVINRDGTRPGRAGGPEI